MTQGSASRSGIGAKPAVGARWAAVLMKQHSLRGIRVPAREAPSLRTRSDFRLSRADYSGATAPDFHRLPLPETMRTWKDIARNARTVNAPAALRRGAARAWSTQSGVPARHASVRIAMTRLRFAPIFE